MRTNDLLSNLQIASRINASWYSTSTTQPAHTHSSAPVRSGELSGLRILAIHACIFYLGMNVGDWIIRDQEISKLLAYSIAKSTVSPHFPRGQLNNWASRIPKRPVTHVHPRARYLPVSYPPNLSTSLSIYPSANIPFCATHAFAGSKQASVSSWREDRYRIVSGGGT